MDGGLDLRQLVHQRFIDVQTAGGIDNQHVAAVVAGVFNGFLDRLYRVLRALFKDRHVDLLAYHLQLLDGGGAVDIAGGQQRLFAFLGQIVGQLATHGGFTGALQAAQHVDRGHGR